MITADIAIVGAGMAGASLAAELAPFATIALIEAEPQPGYHATGRSAAFWTESYGGPGVRPLTSASGTWLARPPADFAERGFLRPRGAIHLADARALAALAALARDFVPTGPALDPLDRAALAARIPGLRPEWRDGLAEPSTADIDVAALHQAYLGAARRHGALMVADAPVGATVRVGDRWRISAGRNSIDAGLLVDAAGAWADDVARLAGARPIGIRPYRRTMLQLRVDPAVADSLPLVLDAAGRVYFKPAAGGRIWLSPHDETAVPAGDAAPDEIDVALAIDRLAHVVDWRVERVERAWAGLRSFAPDRLPVYGFDPRVRGFFWFAGQGGFGIQTAPAAAKLAAAALLGQAPDVLVSGIDIERYSPRRFV